MNVSRVLEYSASLLEDENWDGVVWRKETHGLPLQDVESPTLGLLLWDLLQSLRNILDGQDIYFYLATSSLTSVFLK